MRGLPRANGSTVDGSDKFLVSSVPRIESFKENNEAGMKDSLRGTPDGLLLLDEEGDPREIPPWRGDSSDISL